MRILFDFRVYEIDPYRGMPRYIYYLIDSILKNHPEADISIIKKYENEKPIFNYNNYKVKYYYFDKLDSYDFKDKFDFYFLDDILSTSHKIKDTTHFFNDLYPNKILENSKRIVCIGHDLIPLLFHEYYLNPKSIYFLHLETTKIIEHFFVNSENTKNDFVKYLNIDDKKLTVIYSGVDKKFRSSSKEYNHKNRLNNIVFVSGEDKRKNAQGLIRAFAIAYNSGNIPKDSKLYICCKASAGYSNFLKSTITKCNIKNKVIITGFISDEDMINLISNSKASFFPSFYEGLGLPILESYACLTPSFASNVSSTKEFVLKECSFDPYDDDDMANAIIKAFNDEELCKSSVKFGRKLLKEKCNGDIVSKKVVEKLKELSKTIIMDKAIFIEYNDYKLFSYANSHIFTTIHHYSDMEDLNNSLQAKEYNNDFIPIEYYNKFLDKYEYNKSIFVLGSSKILEYAIKETDKNKSYLFIYKTEIFNIIFDYLKNSLDDFKEIIKKYYYNRYKILEYIDNINDINEIINLLIENKIYGFSILFNITNITNIIINDKTVNNLILAEINLLLSQNTLFNRFNLHFYNFNNLNKDLILSNFCNTNIKNNSKIAVFGILPPEESGIASYNAKAFGKNKNFDVFSDFKSFKNYISACEFLNNDYKYNFIPIEYFDKKIKHNKKIFVLGNSPHNVPYLKYAIEEKDKENSYLYMHEAHQLFLIYFYLNGSITNFKEIIIKNYSNMDKDIKNLKELNEISNALIKKNIYGVKILLSLTNIKNIIVNNDKCEKLIINEVKNTKYYKKLNIIKAFHPIEKLDNIKNNILVKDNSYSYIGTFGILSDYYKSTDIIIKSINILNKKYNKKIKLVVSGYGADEYLKNINKTLQENIISITSKDDKDFISLVDSVDIAIQLRNYPHGESSGVICQLLSLNKKIITTKNFLSKELSDSVREVKPFISAEELSLEILDYLEDKTIIDNSELIKKYSFENLANMLLKL